MRTDWSKRKGREEFLNADAEGNPHTPRSHADCVRFLANERMYWALVLRRWGRMREVLVDSIRCFRVTI